MESESVKTIVFGELEWELESKGFRIPLKGIIIGLLFSL